MCQTPLSTTGHQPHGLHRFLMSLFYLLLWMRLHSPGTCIRIPLQPVAVSGSCRQDFHIPVFPSPACLSLDVWSNFDFVPFLTTQHFAKLLHLSALQNKLNLPDMRYVQGQVSGVKAEGSEGFPRAWERHEEQPGCLQVSTSLTLSSFRKKAEKMMTMQSPAASATSLAAGTGVSSLREGRMWHYQYHLLSGRKADG